MNNFKLKMEIINKIIIMEYNSTYNNIADEGETFPFLFQYNKTIKTCKTVEIIKTFEIRK